MYKRPIVIIPYSIQDFINFGSSEQPFSDTSSFHTKSKLNYTQQIILLFFLCVWPLEAAYTTISKSEDLRNFCIMLVLSKFEDHLYHIPVAAYITYVLLYTVHVEAVSFIHNLRTLQAVVTRDQLHIVRNFTGFIKIKDGSLTVAVINMLLFSIFYKNSSQKCYVCCKYCNIINQEW